MKERDERQMKKIVVLHDSQTQIFMTAEEQKEALDAAIWATASPHEHVWTQRHQVLMARYVLWAHQRMSAVAQVVLDNNL